MGTEEAKAIYKERASTAECVNALARNRGLVLLRVRGRIKVKAIALWYALAHDLLRAATLRRGGRGGVKPEGAAWDGARGAVGRRRRASDAASAVTEGRSEPD